VDSYERTQKLIQSYLEYKSKNDPIFFARRVGFQPDEWQKEVLTWVQRNRQKAVPPGLLLNCGRQTGKSTTAAHLAAHTAIYYKNSLILLVSPSLRQSSEIFRKVRDTLHSLKLEVELDEDNRLSCQLHNKSRIVSLPGIEKTVRGYSGATLIIEDEAARVDDEMNHSVRPMLAVSKGLLIEMSTPFGKRGHFYEAWTSKDGLWDRVEAPATLCPRIDPGWLERERKDIGDWWFMQEYMCKFMDAVDSIFNHDTIMEAISNDVKPLFEVAV
jgi:phage terminase large subunit-like protein